MNATGQMLAALLGWAQATFASKLEMADGAATVTREVDGGLADDQGQAAGDRLGRSAAERAALCQLPNIMKAKSKPLAAKTPADYGVDVTPRLTVREDRRAGRAPGRDQGRLGGRTGGEAERSGGDLMAVLVLGEVTDGHLALDATSKAVTAAAMLGEVTVLCAGAHAAEAGKAAAAIAGRGEGAGAPRMPRWGIGWPNRRRR